MADVVKTFEISEPDAKTEVSTVDTGFSWTSTLLEPEAPGFDVEPAKGTRLVEADDDATKEAATKSKKG